MSGRRAWWTSWGPSRMLGFNPRTALARHDVGRLGLKWAYGFAGRSVAAF
jgi:hypothetical protein